MDDVKPNAIDKRGPGMEPIPEPDKSDELGRKGSTGLLGDVVGGIMDNVQETLTGTRGANSDKDVDSKGDSK